MSITVKSPAIYYEEAEIMLEKKDLVGFMWKIGVAIETAKDDHELLAKATFLNVEALLTKFQQHTKVVEYVPLALKYNVGEKAFNLQEYDGMAKGYLGHVNEAIIIFKNLLEKAETNTDVVRTCMHLVWAYLTLDKDKLDDDRLEEVKGYLERASKYSDVIPDNLLRKIYNNYGVYYFYKNDYDKSIEYVKKSLECSEEKDYAKLYNNLAQIYLHKDDQAVVPEVKENTQKAEIMSNKYKNNLEMGKSFYTQAKAELREGQLFTALDTLYMAFISYKKAEAIAYAYEVMVLINKLMDDYKAECMEILHGTLRKDLEDTLKDSPYQEKL